MTGKSESIPREYHSVTPSLAIRGAAEAIEFYQNVFDAQVRERFDRGDGKVMHAEIKIGDSIVMIGEECAPHEGHKEHCPSSPADLNGTSCSLYLYLDDVDGTLKRASESNGEITMEATDMFWGDRVGSFKDPFGHIWMVAKHIKDVSPEEMRQGAEEFFSQHAQH